MTSAYFINPIVFLIHTLLGLFTAVVLLRFLLQWVRADFYNPVSQFVVKVTTPVRRLIPGFRGPGPGGPGADLAGQEPRVGNRGPNPESRGQSTRGTGLGAARAGRPHARHLHLHYYHLSSGSS